MNGKVFVDTNILLYARDSGQPDKQPIALAWMDGLWRSRQGAAEFPGAARVLCQRHSEIEARFAGCHSPPGRAQPAGMAPGEK